MSLRLPLGIPLKPPRMLVERLYRQEWVSQWVGHFEWLINDPRRFGVKMYSFDGFPENCTKEELEVIKDKLETVSIAAEEHLQFMETITEETVEFVEYDLVSLEEAFLFLYSFWLSKQEADKRTLN